MAAENPRREVRVGYALLPKRQASFMLPELLQYATEKGVIFLKIDPEKPLEEQGPFELIMHKLESESWAQNLKSFSHNHPNVVIVDEYDAVQRLNDRRLMLEAVGKLNPEELGAKIQVPRQLVVEKDVASKDLPKLVENEGFRLPAVAKPTAANGTNSAHSLALALNKTALQHVETPVILQEFVNHGGVLFKLYVLGDQVMVFRRFSLPDIPSLEDGGGGTAEDVVAQLEGRKPRGKGEEGTALPESVEAKDGLVHLNRISNVHLEDGQLDGQVTDPPPELMRALGLRLKQLLELHAFNVDILREGGHGDTYYIVDINYMPGYERMPDFPKLFVDFILSRVAARKEALTAEGAPKDLRQKELSAPLLAPQQPYPVLQGKKKWALFQAAMKLWGLDQRSKKT